MSLQILRALKDLIGYARWFKGVEKGQSGCKGKTASCLMHWAKTDIFMPAGQMQTLTNGQQKKRK